jgi:hypothetical protein
LHNWIANATNDWLLPEGTSPLTEDLVIEILSQLPYSSLCRFKCVSRTWLALCSNPEIRKKSSDLFYLSISCKRTNHFTNFSGRSWPMVDPSLPFLHSWEVEFSWTATMVFCRAFISIGLHEVGTYRSLKPIILCAILQHTSGLCFQAQSRCGNRIPFVWGFNPAVSSTIIMMIMIRPLELRSTRRRPECEPIGGASGVMTLECTPAKSVFFNGVMHYAATGSSLVTGGREGKTCSLGCLRALIFHGPDVDWDAHGSVCIFF